MELCEHLLPLCWVKIAVDSTVNDALFKKKPTDKIKALSPEREDNAANGISYECAMVVGSDTSCLASSALLCPRVRFLVSMDIDHDQKWC